MKERNENEENSEKEILEMQILTSETVNKVSVARDFEQHYSFRVIEI